MRNHNIITHLAAALLTLGAIAAHADATTDQPPTSTIDNVGGGWPTITQPLTPKTK